MGKRTKGREITPSVGRRRSLTSQEAVRKGRRVTWIGFWVNAFLGVIKVVGGIFSRSGALVADGIHSFSDFLSDILVLAMVGVARRKPNTRYPFGHGRFEALATVLLSLLLILVAIGIFYDGIVKVVDSLKGEVLPRPTFLALIIILLSILSKEWLFHFTRRVGKEIKSETVIANAWHHRSDALSSVATLIGVAGAMFLGEKWRILDPIAAMAVGVIIVIVGVDLAKSPLRELLGSSLDKKTRKLIRKSLNETKGVLDWHHLQTFKSGNDGFVMVHLLVDPEISVREAHEIATNAEKEIQQSVKDLKIHATTHIEPYAPSTEKKKKRTK